MRKRLTAIKVTNSPITSKEVVVGSNFGKVGIKRHNVTFDTFRNRGVKVPKNIGKAMLGDIAQLVVPVK